MAFNPMHQFAVTRLLPLYLPWGIDISISNAAISMLISLLIVVSMAYISRIYKDRAMKNPVCKLTKFHMLFELIYQMIETMLISTSGQKALRFMPLIFTIFLFILLNDLVGMIPATFAVTSHIAVTFSIAIVLFIGMTIFGICKHGFNFLSLFIPKGAPFFILPMMFVIELCIYLAKPISLSLRLAANVMAGHIILKVIAYLVVSSGVMGFLPFALLIILTGFEIFVSILQAYIFTMLVCVYLNDAINLH
ncbi:F0F1 ATP synthase subunit A [Lyticum sinuosum]|uniref:ATP synthase subunit a n=1 Tax=Lyticum sinuosum TaxID=1332059 RepID=A0AAE4VMD4_9RICK|nr:F0F1 ATP synthase subunit A [Lyticum sinuosum]MDZ5761488.1 ATP synthase subunit a [Lyticum sinuosum]